MKVKNLIERVNSGNRIEEDELKSIIANTELPIFGCTEISMLAYKEGLNGIDTLEITIDKIVNKL